MSFHSSFTKVAPTVKQTLYFSGGDSKTIDGIITSKIKQSEYTELTCTNGVTWSINPKKVNYFKTESESDKPLGDIQQTGIKKIYHFSDGSKLCLDNISGIKQGEFIKVYCTDGVIWSINPENVNCFEDIRQENEIKVRSTWAEAEWDATLTGTGYCKISTCLEEQLKRQRQDKAKMETAEEEDNDDKPFFQDFLDKHPEVNFSTPEFKNKDFIGCFTFLNSKCIELYKKDASSEELFKIFFYPSPWAVNPKYDLTQQQVLDLLEETLGTNIKL